jgi:hypothetical protein
MQTPSIVFGFSARFQRIWFRLRTGRFLIRIVQDNGGWRCSVCLDGSGTSFRRACGHKLHLPCMLGLIESNHSCPCPECRSTVLIDPDQVAWILGHRREPLPSDCFLQISQDDSDSESESSGSDESENQATPQEKQRG